MSPSQTPRRPASRSSAPHGSRSIWPHRHCEDASTSTASTCCSPASCSIRPRVPRPRVEPDTASSRSRGPRRSPAVRRSARSRSRASTSPQATPRTRASWCGRSPARCTGAGRSSSKGISPPSAAWRSRSRPMTSAWRSTEREARIVLDAGRRLITGSLSASSTVAGLRAEGSVRLDGDGEFDLRYDADGRLEQLGRWWQGNRRLAGAGHAAGPGLGGPLRRPEATIAAKGTGLRWAIAAECRARRVGAGVDRRARARTRCRSRRRHGTLQGSGRFTFSRTGARPAERPLEERRRHRHHRPAGVDGRQRSPRAARRFGDAGVAGAAADGECDRGQARRHRHRRGTGDQRRRRPWWRMAATAAGR